MTLAVRNGILITGAVLSIIGLVAFAVGGIGLVSGSLAGAGEGVTLEQNWYWMSWQVSEIAPFLSLASSGALGLLAVVGILACARLFRRVNSPEIYFVALFLMSCSVELARMAVAVAVALELPLSLALAVTRLVLFSRLLGALSLFSAGVYAAGAEYPRIGSITLLIAALSFVVIYFTPVDNDALGPSFLYAPGASGLDLLIGFLSLGTIVNYVIGWSRGHREQNAVLVLAMAALVIGKEIVLHLPSIAALASGLVLIAAAVTGIILVNRSYYLWY